MQNKSHEHVKKSRAFSNARIISELMLTLIKMTITERRNKLVFRHCLKMITTKVVKMLYPGDTEHIGYNIQSDHYERTSNTSNKEMY